MTAAYLAHAGWRVLVLERRNLVGGACVTEEVFPGYRVSTAAYLVSLMQERVVRDLDLRRFGYEVLPKDPAYFAPFLDGRYLMMYADQRRTCAEIAKFSRRDAERYPAYEAFVESIARFIEPMLLQTPPNLPPRTPLDLVALGRLGSRLLRMRPAQLGHLTRMFTGSAREVLEAWFESDQLKVALATDGVIGSNAGPASPGTAYVLLHHVMGGVGGVRGLWGFRQGRHGRAQPGARTARPWPPAPRSRSPPRFPGSSLPTAEHTASCSRMEPNSAPGSSFPMPTQNAHSSVSWAESSYRASSRSQIDAYKCEGASFKINLALGELPNFTALPGSVLGPQHRGTTHICPEHRHARARLG